MKLNQGHNSRDWQAAIGGLLDFCQTMLGHAPSLFFWNKRIHAKERSKGDDDAGANNAVATRNDAFLGSRTSVPSCVIVLAVMYGKLLCWLPCIYAR